MGRRGEPRSGWSEKTKKLMPDIIRMIRDRESVNSIARTLDIGENTIYKIKSKLQRNKLDITEVLNNVSRNESSI